MDLSRVIFNSPTIQHDAFLDYVDSFLSSKKLACRQGSSECTGVNFIATKQ
jgi:hypothetical protein